MTQEAITTSKEYILKLTAMNIHKIESNIQGLYISGTANFQMLSSATTKYATGNTVTNYIVPDFSQTIAGTFTVASDTPVIELRKLPIEKAKSLIHSYIKKHPGSRTSDIIVELGLDPDIVLKVLSKLKKEQKVEGRNLVQ